MSSGEETGLPYELVWRQRLQRKTGGKIGILVRFKHKLRGKKKMVKLDRLQRLMQRRSKVL